MTLFEHLSNFKRHSSEEKLTAAFEKLAPHFIYGGYIKVNDAYRVYIRTIEFYYHDESDKPDAIKDPIMYHRNHTKKRNRRTLRGTLFAAYVDLHAQLWI